MTKEAGEQAVKKAETTIIGAGKGHEAIGQFTPRCPPGLQGTDPEDQGSRYSAASKTGNY